MREASSIYLCMSGQPNGRWPLPYAGQPPDDDGTAARAAAAPPRRAIPSGAIAGAAVCGAVVALLLAAAVTACALAGVSRRRQRGDAESGSPPPSSPSPSPSSSASPPKHKRWAELPILRRHPSTAKQSSDDPSSTRVGRNGGLVENGTPTPPLPPLPASPSSRAAATGVPSNNSLGAPTSTITHTHPLTLPVAAGAAGGATREGAWLRRRIGPADAPDELAIGPLIGRGSFGAVYKARWFGGLCALKVVPPSPEAASAAVASAGAGGGVAASDLTPVSAAVGVRVGRELSLGVALSHPHLVATYRAWVVDAGAVGAHRASWEDGRSGGDDTAAAAAASAAAWTRLPPSPSPPNTDRSISLDRADSGLLAEVEEAAAAAAAAGTDPAAAAAAAASTLTAIAPTTTPDPAPREAWILLELCSLGTLDAAVRARRFAPAGSPAALAAALRTLRDVAAGMEYLHAHTVVHGDLKACNVLLKPAPRTTFDARGFTAKVADFGLARFVGARGHVSTHTHGSVQYMAPEVLAARRVGLPADVFSFGVLAAEVLTGRKPHSGRTVGAAVHAVVSARERPDVPAAVAPAALRALVDACCEDDEGARPTFAAILGALHAFCEGDWDGGDAIWHRGGGMGAGGKGAAAVARVVPAVVVKAARVASGGSMGGGGAAVAVSTPGKGRGGPPSDAWAE